MFAGMFDEGEGGTTGTCMDYVIAWRADDACGIHEHSPPSSPPRQLRLPTSSHRATHRHLLRTTAATARRHGWTKVPERPPARLDRRRILFAGATELPGRDPTREALLNDVPRSENDNLPDDFKFGGVVAEATLDIRMAFIRKVYAIL
jgi:hypothetical protein